MKNLAASIRARLLNLSRESGEPLDSLMEHWLSRHQTFDGDLLIESIQATFARRNTEIPENPPIALTEIFANDSGKTLQWEAFRRKGKLAAPELTDVIARLSEFLLPLLSEEARGQTWQPDTGWTSKSS